MKQEDEIAIELKSEPMNEMLSNPPKWIVSSGSGMFLIILSVIIALTWFIRYPDEVSGDVLVTTSKAPIELSNQSYIQLMRLNVAENQVVKRGDLIAQFDIQAKSEDLYLAMNYLNGLLALGGTFEKQLPVFEQELQLGTFQEQWMMLLSKIRAWNSAHLENMAGKEMASIGREIAFREQLQVLSSKKMKLSENEYKVIQEQLASSERLVEKEAISKQMLAQDKRTQTEVLQSVHSQKEQHIQNLITLNVLRKELLKLEHDERQTLLQKASEIQLALIVLKNGFQTWEKNSVWIAPCAGTILFNKMLQVNRFYKPNEASIVIVPAGTGYLAVATVTSTGAGKLKVGQKAFVELTDFPKSEYGMLEGRIDAMTQIDKEGKYEVKIALPWQLRTSFGQQIPPKAQLKGKVKIITKDKRLLGRFFKQLTDLMQ
jgi:multidrug efflux pump subunit AcrA (membrane-fusion protein)